MARPSTLLLVALATITPGCVTAELWRAGIAAPPRDPIGVPARPTVVRAERASRTYDGLFHLEVRCTDDAVRHLTLDAAPGRAPILLPDDEAFPDGEPVPLGRFGAERRPDAYPALRYDDRRVFVYRAPEDVDAVRFPALGGAAAASSGAPSRSMRAAKALGTLALTPFTLALDAAFSPVQITLMIAAPELLPSPLFRRADD
jgi:hypothetical protein